MTKSEVVKEIKKRTGIQRAMTATIVEELMETIKTNMAAGENIYLRGFGTFEVRRYAAKRAYIINDGSYKVLPGHCVPTFKPGKEMMAQTPQEGRQG